MDKIKLQIPVVITKFIEVELELSEDSIIEIGEDLKNYSSLNLDDCYTDEFIDVIESNTDYDLYEQIAEKFGSNADINWEIDDLSDYDIVNLFKTIDKYNKFQTKLKQLNRMRESLRISDR